MTTQCHNSQNGSAPHNLSVHNLHAHYGRVCALHDISFETSCGRSIALLGGNGAGKTTLMKAIIGLLRASTGEVLWRGVPVKRNTPEIAYLPQRQDLDWHFPMKVRALVEMGRYPYLGPWTAMGAEDEHAVDEAMETMQITRLADRQIGALSGGQQQRVFIARALAQRAHVLLLDEPFSGLDQPSSETLAELLGTLTKRGTLIIASYHDLRTVSRIFDEILLVNRHLIAHGPASEVLNEEQIKEAFSS